ncbi:MAG: PspC domain-containing protein [Clostridia bacterium]
MNRRLYRSRTQRKIAGVCGGIAEYFQVDVTLIRLLALLLFFTGGGLLIYIIAAIVIPEEPVAHTNSNSLSIDYNEYDEYEMQKQSDPTKTKALLGWGLVMFASVMIMDRFLPMLPFKRYLFPVLLLVGGYYLISQSSNKN